MSHDGVMAGERRGFETVRDMVLSMAVVGAVVLAIFLVVVWQRPEVQGSIRPAVDVTGIVDQVELTSPFIVVSPVDLPDDWSPTSAWYDPATENGDLDGGLLHLGYQTSSGAYAEAKQSDGDADVLVREYADEGEPAGEYQHGGVEWQRLKSLASGKLALLTTDAATSDGGQGMAPVVLVTGTADWAELETLAQSLTP